MKIAHYIDGEKNITKVLINTDPDSPIDNLIAVSYKSTISGEFLIPVTLIGELDGAMLIIAENMRIKKNDKGDNIVLVPGNDNYRHKLVNAYLKYEKKLDIHCSANIEIETSNNSLLPVLENDFERFFNMYMKQNKQNKLYVTCSEMTHKILYIVTHMTDPVTLCDFMAGLIYVLREYSIRCRFVVSTKQTREGNELNLSKEEWGKYLFKNCDACQTPTTLYYGGYELMKNEYALLCNAPNAIYNQLCYYILKIGKAYDSSFNVDSIMADTDSDTDDVDMDDEVTNLDADANTDANTDTNTDANTITNIDTPENENIMITPNSN